MPTGHDLAMALRDAYLALHRRTDGALAPCAITADQFVLMAALAERDALTQRELARRASSDPNTVRAMLLILEGRGLVARRRHPTDSRARTVALTARGQRLYKRLWAAGEPVRAELVAALHPPEVEQLIGLLERVVRAVSGTNGETEATSSDRDGDRVRAGESAGVDPPRPRVGLRHGRVMR
jgi:DNA-binding MarR family transcriptional regulator